MVAHPHWPDDYERAASEAQLSLTLEQAVAELNAWLALIDAAAPTVDDDAADAEHDEADADDEHDDEHYDEHSDEHAENGQ